MTLIWLSPVLFLGILALIAWTNACADRRFLAAGGECVTCHDTGAPRQRDVHCTACKRWLKGYEP